MGVHKEQWTSYDDELCPSDAFHPDFQCGCSAYFDISICSTTQPAFISSFASCGEIAKDEKYLAAVEKVGFYSFSDSLLP